VTQLTWDWGDGTSDVQWFPATHTYAITGTHLITVTAFNDIGNEAATNTVARIGTSGQVSAWSEDFTYANYVMPNTIIAQTVRGIGTIRLRVLNNRLQGDLSNGDWGHLDWVRWQPQEFVFDRYDSLTLEYEGREEAGAFGAPNWYHRIQIAPADASMATLFPIPRIDITTQGFPSETKENWIDGVDADGNGERLVPWMYSKSTGEHIYRVEVNHVNGTYRLGAMRFYRDGVLEYASDGIFPYLGDLNTLRFDIRSDDPDGLHVSTWDNVSILPGP
jgi:hypothetical protein